MENKRILTLNIINVTYNGVSKEKIEGIKSSYQFELVDQSSFSPLGAGSSETEKPVLENIVLGLNSSLRENIPFENLIGKNAFFYNGQLYLPKDLASSLKLKKRGKDKLYYSKKFVPATSELKGASGDYTNPYVVLARFTDLQ